MGICRSREKIRRKNTATTSGLLLLRPRSQAAVVFFFIKLVWARAPWYLTPPTAACIMWKVARFSELKIHDA